MLPNLMFINFRCISRGTHPPPRQQQFYSPHIIGTLHTPLKITLSYLEYLKKYRVYTRSWRILRLQKHSNSLFRNGQKENNLWILAKSIYKQMWMSLSVPEFVLSLSERLKMVR